ncbi:TetR/AcrR family transcriptional regulator [Inconstantimicrobium mannanitabidum]|uniref:TetR family transcriptional regulator n=1 Tax=Inconstantimicrobium mannanitabidum TaxID=1604901 RepID=A0ACB5RA23_9CLOT|nr:TetR/AcrR family transcriptional regulator [Clostridium sp. TW13]GKX65897.1 TetR family transcriptional regulator [Clostridium sp. TW13]
MIKDEIIDNPNNKIENKKSNDTDSIRKPKQARSIETKRKILDTALKLFCNNGFHKTTTNEIARESGVPIGSLYSYFKNKDMILIEILDDYHQSFADRISSLSNEKNIEIAKQDKRAWIRGCIEMLIKLHEETKEFNLELQALQHSIPEVAALHEEHDLEIQSRIMREFEPFKEEMNITDFEAAAIVLNDVMSSTVDRIVFTKLNIERERIIDCTVEVVYKYLFN